MEIRASVFKFGLGLCAGVLFSTTAFSGTPNLLSNGNFDSGVTSWTDNGAAVWQSSGQVRVGPAAGGRSQLVKSISSGLTYALTAIARAELSGDVGYVGLHFLDSAGKVIVQQTITVPYSSKLQTNSLIFTAPVGAVSANVWIWKNAGSSASYLDVDSVSFFLLADAFQGASNILKNGSFDTDLTSWGDYGNSSWTAGQVRVGTASGGRWQAVSAVIPGQIYSLNTSARSELNNDVGYVGLDFFDAAGAKIIQQTLTIAYSSNLTTMSLSFVAPSNAVSANAWIWKNAGNSGSYLDVDSVSLLMPSVSNGPIGRPSAATTGPASNTNFATSAGIKAVSNMVYENLDITGQITIPTGVVNVTIRNCKIHGADYGVKAPGGTGGAANVKIYNNKIYDVASAGIYGDNFTASYNEIYRSGGDGFKPGDNTIIEYNFVHDLGWQTKAQNDYCLQYGGCPHADGIQMQGASNVIIRNNFFYMPSPGNKLEDGSTYSYPTGYVTHSNRTIFLQKAPGNKISVVGNWLWSGNDYSLQMFDSTLPGSITVTNNVLYAGMLSGAFGWLQSGIVWSGNVDQLGATVQSNNR